jgi:hypothetical protein
VLIENASDENESPSYLDDEGSCWGVCAINDHLLKVANLFDSPGESV